jgi:hypothetical protein
MDVHNSPRAPKARATAATHVRRDGREDPYGCPQIPWVSINHSLGVLARGSRWVSTNHYLWLLRERRGRLLPPAFCLTRGWQPNETW